jgi:hypothetical protein
MAMRPDRSSAGLFAHWTTINSVFTIQYSVNSQNRKLVAADFCLIYKIYYFGSSFSSQLLVFNFPVQCFDDVTIFTGMSPVVLAELLKI